MMSIQNLKSADQAEIYYERDDYYVDDECPSMWWGKGAESLGLRGEVGKADFKDLLNGKLPDGTEMPDNNGNRRPGVDLTFSAPKSVSLMSLVAGDERILKAHREAVSKALEWLEKTSAQARMTEGRKTRTEATGNLLVARFDHDTSRELDPQLHTHSVAENATQRADGEWRALSNEKLYDNKMAAGAIYRAELADKLRALGYEIVVTHTDGRFEIRGISRDVIDHFSQRREQIQASLEELGFSSQKAAEIAALNTREAKKDVDRANLKEEWRERALDVGMNFRIPRAWELNSDNEKESKMASARRIASLGVDHLSERASVFGHEDLVRFGMERGTGSTNLDSVESAISEMRNSGQLIHVGDGRYTTEKAIMLEREIISTASRGQGRFAPISGKEKVEKALQGLGLTEDQAEAAERIAGSRDMVVGVQGYAGTGKTRMLSVVKEIAEDSGYEVRGFSSAATAANILQKDTGIKSDTLAMHLLGKALSKEIGNKKSPQIWVIDESSMMGTAQAAKLLKLAESRDARMVFVGDYQQLPSIEAGKPFAMLMDKGAMEVATLKTIMRQKVPELKKAVLETIHGDSEASVQTLGSRINEIEDRSKRLAAVAESYLIELKSVDDAPIVVTGTNKDRHDINNLIRVGLEQRGILSGEKVESEILTPKSFTRAELRETTSYMPGTVVRFGRDYKSLGVKKGEYVQVESMDSKNQTVTLKDGSGRTFEWKPWKMSKVEAYGLEGRELRSGDKIRWTRNDRDKRRRNRETVKVLSVDVENGTVEIETAKGVQVLDIKSASHWEYAYASTVHAAQGKTKEMIIIHIDTRQKNVVGFESWYVSISRTKYFLKCYTNDIARLPEAIKRIMAQESAIEELERSMEFKMVGKEKDLDMSPEKRDITKVHQHDRGGGFGLGGM